MFVRTTFSAWGVSGIAFFAVLFEVGPPASEVVWVVLKCISNREIQTYTFLTIDNCLMCVECEMGSMYPGIIIPHKLS